MQQTAGWLSLNDQGQQLAERWRFATLNPERKKCAHHHGAHQCDPSKAPGQPGNEVLRPGGAFGTIVLISLTVPSTFTCLLQAFGAMGLSAFYSSNAVSEEDAIAVIQRAKELGISHLVRLYPTGPHACIACTAA